MSKAYLDCVSREAAERLWRAKLREIGYFHNIPEEMVPLEDALGRITAQCQYARRSVPHYNGAAMDGIAVHAADTFGAAETSPKRLRVLPPGSTFETGGCFIVDTGDLLPAGTNAVIMREDVYFSGGEAEIAASATPWQHVRIIGEDVVAQEIVLPEQHQIAPADIAVLLAAGIDTVNVIAKPKVTVIPTGSELVAHGDDLAPGKILDVNSHMLCAAVRTWGGVPYRRPIVPDDYQLLKEAVASSLAVSDMVITNAGTSAGTEDFTAAVLAELGEVLVHGVAIKPGKPVVLAVCQGKPVIGLPGYPVSAMLTAELFVKPVLRDRQCLPPEASPLIKASLARQIYSQAGTEEYIRVSVGSIDGKNIAAPLSRGAGLITSLTKAEGIVIAGQAQDGIAAGTEVEVRLLREAALPKSLIAIGSHDLALDLLAMHLKRRCGVRLSCANVGSMGGVMAIRGREAHMAGIHILDQATGEYNVAAAKQYLTGRPWCLLALARREQGLLVAAGNPKHIHSLADLARRDVSFVNRQRGSGTRMLLDYGLLKLGMDGRQIQGYDKEVGTHMAVAATITAKAADVGLGIRAAANALGLDFIPVGQEEYDLLLSFPAEHDMTKEIISILTSEEFRRDVEALGGYDLSQAGLIKAEGG